MLLDFVRLIIRDMSRRKFSTFLTLLAISLGILAIYSIISISFGFENSLTEEFEKLGTNRLLISARGVDLTDDELNYIRSRPYIESAFGFYMKSVQLKYGNDFSQSMVLGMPLEEEYISDMQLEIDEGRMPSSNEKYSMIMGPLAAEDLFDREVVVGSNIYLKDTKFKVVGITNSLGNPQDDRNIYVNIDTLRDLYDEGESLDQIMAKVYPGEDMEIVSENLDRSLENRLEKDAVNVQTFDQLISQFTDILGIVQATLGAIAFVSLVVGAFGIINTMYVIVTEKIKEIGIMKSVGATNGSILTLYMMQSGFYGLFGAIFGIGIGIIATYLFEVSMRSAGFSFLTIGIEPSIIIGLLFFGFVIGLLSGYLPARRASKMNIVESLRK